MTYHLHSCLFFSASTKRNSILSKKLKDAESHLRLQTYQKRDGTRLQTYQKRDGTPDQRQSKLFGQVTKKFVVALKKFPAMNALTKRVKLKHLAFSRKSKASILFLQLCL